MLQNKRTLTQAKNPKAKRITPDNKTPFDSNLKDLTVSMMLNMIMNLEL